MRHPAIIFLLVVSHASCAFAANVLVEAERFENRGGWLTDAQFVDQMGSAYLMAHGLGVPVADASTRVQFPETGTYHLWVRTKDWAAPHQPGRFRVVVDDAPAPVEFGIEGDQWAWQNGGAVEIRRPQITVQLQDLTGFNGRCDALLLTTDPHYRPPNTVDDKSAAWRRRLLGFPASPPHVPPFDVVVVGGGIAGCSAAVAASRLGLQVALVQNRPVLGGNSSSEIGIRPAGFDRSIVTELVGEERERVVRSERNIRLFLGWHAFRVTKDQHRMTAVDIQNTQTCGELRLSAPVFVDCTGDGWLGYRAGADFRMGREARSEFDESLAPEQADRMTHGATLYFKLAIESDAVEFPSVPWAVEVAGDHIDVTSNHSWEYGHRRDMIADAEPIRDHLLRAIYGTFSNVRARFPAKTANVRLQHVNHVAARGESRRLLGDYILNENDLRSREPFPDAVAQGGLVFCLHYPGEEYDFRNRMELLPVEPYGIPLRCLYSRNVENLMMAGRDVSATHIAYSSIKLMKTGGQMGVAVGAAASLCKKYDTTPRGVYEHHLPELGMIVSGQGEYEGVFDAPIPNGSP